MLNQFFGRESLPLLDQGPLAQYLKGFCKQLCDQGYARGTIRRYVSQASHFSRYLQSRNIPIRRSLRSDMKAFVQEHLPACRCSLVGLRFDKAHCSLERLLEHLSARGLEPKPPPPLPCDAPPLLKGYLEHLRGCRGLAAGTVRNHRWCLQQFLKWLGPDSAPHRLGRLTASKVEDFCLSFGLRRGRSQRHCMQTTLRSFLAFCLKEGHLSRDLVGAVPVLRTYSLASLPRAISDSDARRVLSGIDTGSAEGLRDFAIFQILFCYGVRAAHVRTLRLDQILWEQSRIRLPALKGGRSLDLPLTEAVGNSLLDYLRMGRTPSSRPEVFLGSRAPYGPLRSSFPRIIARRMQAAGIDAPLRTRAFRHAFASRMLRQGQSLKAVADLLGHRALQTAFIYTKVDFRALREVALPWPEASS
ncbi:MAG: site-specific integrase [Acidobacteriota bacterium]